MEGLKLGPGSSTGVETPNGPGFAQAVIGFGWLQGTTRSADRERLLDRLCAVFGDVVERRGGVQWYARSFAVGDLGVLVACDPVSSSSEPSELLVTIPQSALDALGWRASAGLIRELLGRWGLRASRLDVYMDDRARVADPSDVLRAMTAGATRSHARSYRAVADSEGGMTVYVGSRQGEVMLRVYRKWAESGDPSQGVRWEVEYRGARADAVVDLFAVASAPGVLFVELLRGFVDFVEPVGRAWRAPLLGWWALLVGSAGRARVATAVVVRTLGRVEDWVRRQVAPSLALLVAYRGPDLLGQLVDDGRSRVDWGRMARVRAPSWFPQE